MLHYLKLMLQLVLSPKKGWEDIAQGADPSRRTLLHGLLPMIGMVSLTVFLGAFYELRPTFGGLLVKAVVAFAQYAITYFIGVTVLSSALPRLSEGVPVGRETIEVFCAYIVGLMATIGVLENLLPMDLSLLHFLPIYAIAVMCMGRQYLKVDERNLFRFAAVATVSLILPVFVVARLIGSAV